MSREWKWTEFQENKLEKVNHIIAGLRRYWPLTLRQIFYQMVGAGHIPNKQTEYQMLSVLLTNARYDGLIPWEVMEDRVRRYVDLSGYTDAQSFVEGTTGAWLNLFNRNLMQTQDIHIELWTEKDALSSLFERVCKPYTVPVQVCRGFNSTTFMNMFRDRVPEEETVAVLYFGDFDPSGMYMSERDLPERFSERLGLDIDTERIALNAGDPQRFNLFSDPDSFKRTDPRAKWFIAEGYGDIGYELDALSPGQLEQIVQDAIEARIDIDLYHEQQQLETADRNLLDGVKNAIESEFT